MGCSGIAVSRRLRWIAVIAALSMASPAQTGPAPTVTTLQNSIQSSIAHVDHSLVAMVAVGSAGPMIVGTGFFVSNEGTFVTAFHVLQQGPGITMRALPRGNGDQLYGFATVAMDPARDLALCRLVAAPGNTLPRMPAVSLAEASDVVPGTLVVLSGFPLASKNASSHLGMISSTTSAEESLEIGALVNEGESGAPILRLDNGEVIGMVSAVRTASTYAGSGRGVEDQNSGITLGSRAEWLRALLARADKARER